MKFLLPLAVLSTLLVGGCGEGGVDQKLVQNPSAEEMNAAKARKNEMIDIYNRAGGKWENLTPEDKARVIELSNGQEGLAMQGFPAIGAMTKD